MGGLTPGQFGRARLSPETTNQDMQYMFYKAYDFNQPIGSWDTSAVTNMQYMFDEARKFNQPIGSWNTSAVTDMRYMFYWAWDFDTPIGSWDVSSLKSILSEQ